MIIGTIPSIEIPTIPGVEAPPTSTRFVNRTDLTVRSGASYEILNDTGRGVLDELMIRSPSRFFSISIVVDTVNEFASTYEDLTSIGQNSPSISAFTELDMDGSETGFYVVSIRSIPYFAGIRAIMYNDDSLDITYSNIFAKYRIIMTS